MTHAATPRPAGPRSIAVCADDFGLDPQVNAGALILAGQGRLSAIACMVGAPFWKADARELRHLDASRVQTGLHLDLTEHPLDARMRRPLSQWILRSHARAVDRRALRREIDAQLDAFAGEMDWPPDFVDGHEYVHQLPAVRDELVEALLARGWRPWLRSTRRPAGLHTARARVIEALGAAALARRAQSHGLRQNRRLLGIYGFDGDEESYLARMRQWLALADTGDLLVCHPAAKWPRSAAHPAARCREYAVLAGDAMTALLQAAGVQVAPLSPI
jgi:predicted glycoside hydrolase/deacetylase ChbG (UPF0249 family)